MELRQIGSLQVSSLGLGTNNFGMKMAADEVPPVVEAALDAGINFFDTADSYGASEERLGAALGSRRTDVVIATKFGSVLGGQEHTGGARPEYVRSAAEASLQRLGTDYIDLYQLHRPDPATPIADTLGALADLVRAGTVREIGCSNFSATQLQEAADAAVDGITFVSVQNEYNLLNIRDDDDVIPQCRRLGMSYLPFFPLASGLLTGKYVRGEGAPAGTRLHLMGARAEQMLGDETFDRLDQLVAWASARGRSLHELAFAFLLSNDAVPSVIAGATSPDQLESNVRSADWRLSPDEMAEVAGRARAASGGE